MAEGFDLFSHNIGKTLFGDRWTMQDLERQIREKEQQIQQTRDVRLRDMLTTELDQMKTRLADQMKAQGATDEQGKLLAAKDVQEQFLDKDYLNLRKMQQKEIEQQQLAQALRAGKQMQLQGSQRNVSPFEIAGQMEAVQRRGQEGLAADVRGETLRAKGEAGTELQRKQQYATQLTDYERQNLQDRISGTIQQLNIDQQTKDNLVQQLDSMPEGELINLARQGIKGFVSMISSGGTAGDFFGNIADTIGRTINFNRTPK